MSKCGCYLSWFLLLCSTISVSQENIQFVESQLSHQQASMFINEQLYGVAKFRAAEKSDVLSKPFPLPDYYEIDKNNLHIEALSLIILDESVADDIAELAIYKYPNSDFIPESTRALADFYYIRNDYKNAVKYYDQIDFDNFLDVGLSFRQAYSHFVLKEFQESSTALSRIKNLRSPYYDAANYYYAMSAYFLNNYPSAIRSLELVQDHPVYKKYNPYYLGQLYFAQGELDKMINYVEPRLSEEDIYNKNQLHKLLGQAYMRKSNYHKALEHLEVYERNTEKLTEIEFYQIAVSYYHIENYRKAARSFEELSKFENEYQVSSLYYLADIYLKKSDKQSAKIIFKSIKTNTTISLEDRYDAQWNYACLAVETENSREAITALLDIPESSPYYSDAQSLMVKELYQSEDYQTALDVINEMDDPSNEIKVIHQKISLRQAKLLYLDKDFIKCRQALIDVERYAIDKNILGESYYWLARLSHENSAYQISNNHLSKFFDLKPVNLPFEASAGMAYYMKAYNHYKLKQYPEATLSFRASINTLKANMLFYDKIAVSRLLADAYVRKGDAHFLISDYDDAVIEYNNAVIQDKTAADYALYQKSLIEGLQGKNYDKLLSLEELVSYHPDSKFRDKALFQLANTHVILNNQVGALEKLQILIDDYSGQSTLINKANLKAGLLSYNLGDSKRAISYYKATLSNQPTAEEKNEALTALKEIYIEDQANAEEYFQIAGEEGIELTDFSKDSLSYVGGSKLYKSDRYSEAIPAFEKYLNTFPNGNYKLDAHYYLGESHLAREEYSAALIHYLSVINLGVSSFYIDALKKAAVISFNHEKNFENSLALYTSLTAMELSSDEIKEARFGAFNSALKLTNHEEIIKQGLPLTISSGLTNEQKAEIHYYIAKSYLANGKADYAISEFNQVVRNSKNSQAAEASYTISEIFFKRGDMQASETQALETTRTAANYPYWVAKSLMLIAKIYETNEDYLNAKAAIEAVLENYQEETSIILEAEVIRDSIQSKIDNSNRIRIDVDTTILELDTIRNERN